MAAFDDKDNDAAEVTDAMGSSTPSLNLWDEIEESEEQHECFEKEHAIIGCESQDQNDGSSSNIPFLKELVSAEYALKASLVSTATC
jgi:hypothetical protein